MADRSMARCDGLGGFEVRVVGHADTAAVLGVPLNRATVSLDVGDVVYVAQLRGGRLPEGTTSLPEGFGFDWIRVTI